MSIAHIIEWTVGTISGTAFTLGSAMAAMQAPDVLPLSWDKITASGAAGCVLLCVWLFLRRDERIGKEHADQLKERDGTIKSIAHEFSETSTGIARTFAESTAKMDERAQQREARLSEMFQKLMDDRA
jgi:hypothetical protein